MLQVIISPAKQMRVAADAFAPRGIPPFPERTERLVRELRDIERRQGPEGLKALWRVNDKLLAENIERLHGFEPVSHEAQLDDPAVARLVSPAAFSYVGIQYRSMAPEVMGFSELEWLQAHLWVLSGLYGCVRPFDAVQPYRLEMGAKLAVDGARLYVAGDTDRNPDNMQVPCDVALVPVGGTYTMDAAQAAEFVNALQPRVAIPTHYGSVAGEPQDGEAFAAQVAPDIEVVLKMER